MKLKNLYHILCEIQNKVSEKEKAEKLKEEMERKKGVKLKRLEDKFLPEKIKMSKEIFEWANEFAKSGEYKKIIQLANEHFYHIYGLTDLVGRGVQIYAINEWGHTTEYKEYGLRSHLYHSYLHVKPDGSIQYISYYKYIGVENFSMEKPEELAKKLSRAYIEDVYKNIKSGGILERIIKILEEEKHKLVPY